MADDAAALKGREEEGGGGASRPDVTDLRSGSG